MSIHALPQTAVRAIGSSQTLTDPASVVKELIDNAIDARATSVSIDISANTLDVIQVRDNGHGIAPDDRPLVARRYCTSKIKDEKDLAKIGGSFLGFRGEALSSAAEMSGGIIITTRVEGEDIATAMKINPDGEVSTQERASHPIGTTVRMTDFLSKHPVRKQVALKGSVKIIGKIKQLLQQYAFARPTTRLSLRVLKAKNDRDNWTYAPRAGADVDDTAMKVVGKPCASECSWHELESEGFQIRAYVPQISANISHVSGAGQYLSVDGRPMATSRGVFRQIVKIFKDGLKQSQVDLERVKDPFMYLGIVCPPGSYDPNVEPAKDDVLFEDSDVVLTMIRQLFAEAYPVVEILQPTIHVPSCTKQFEEQEYPAQDPITVSGSRLDQSVLGQAQNYKTNMYDMDEEDLALLVDMANESAQNPAGEDEDADQKSNLKPTSSNPFIMAKMNARTGKTNLGHSKETQLITPARETGISTRLSSSPTRGGVQSVRPSPFALPTPIASSPLPHSVDDYKSLDTAGSANGPAQYPHQTQSPAPGVELSDEYQETQPYSSVMGVSPSEMPRLRNPQPMPSQYDNQEGTSLDQIPEAPQRRRGAPRKAQDQYVNKPFKPPVAPQRDTWSPTAEEQVAAPPVRKARQQRTPQAGGIGNAFVDYSQPRILSPPPNNRDIRSFIGPKKVVPAVDDQDISYLGEQSVPHLVGDENSAPRDNRAGGPAIRTRSGDFIPASDLNLIEVPHLQEVEGDTPHHPRPPRRRKTGERTLVEVTGNRRAHEDSDDDRSYEPGQQSTKRRRTTDGGTNPKRTKSSKLPLERVPEDQWMQQVLLPLSVSEAQIGLGLKSSGADAMLLPWNEPAFGDASVLKRAGDREVERWSAKLRKLLNARFTEGEMVGDVESMVRVALLGADEA